MDEVKQEYHPLVQSLQNILGQAYGLGDTNALIAAVPLSAIIAYFIGEKNPNRIFSKEFLAVLEAERERFRTKHEFDCNYLMTILFAESKRIIGLEEDDD